MADTHGTPLTGRKVAMMFCGAFAVIISVNLTLAYQAVATFPGLEVKNSYVASQHFDANRKAQEALGWDVGATLVARTLTLSITSGGAPVEAKLISATLGRATNVAHDETPAFKFDGHAFVAPVNATHGYWNLRLVAEADNGVRFQQRIMIEARP